MTSPEPDKYIIRGGEQGRSRLAVIARVLAPTTCSLLDRFEPMRGMVAVDAGCGGGDVALELARRVGPDGRVIGLDLDELKLALARDEASGRGIVNVEFRRANMLDAWPVNDVCLANLRFVLTHMANPRELLQRAHDALQPGGVVVVEDIDYGGQFCDPPSAAVDRYCEVYVRAARQHGGNPFVGRSLVGMLESVGFSGVDSCLVQPYGRTGDIKQVAPLTLAAIGETVRSSGILAVDELEQLVGELQAFVDREDTTISFPRIFQAWGRKR